MTKPAGLIDVPFEAETWGTPIEHEAEQIPHVPPDLHLTRRGEATNREAQAPLPASVSATREGSQGSTGSVG